MADVIPIAESASRAVTNGQLAQETHAVPHRVLLGATKADFVRRGRVPRCRRSSRTCRCDDGVDEPEREGSSSIPTDMTNFETMVNMYARLASGWRRCRSSTSV
jgi:hypothetical protein